MRLRFGLIGQFLLLLLVACQDTSGGANATSTPSPGDAVDPLETPTTSTFPESESILTPTDAYPPPPPPPIPSPEGYPGPATPFPTPDPYPAGDLVWIIRPVGEQCADPAASDIADLQEAIVKLAAAGVPAEASGMVDLVVCTACGCPTSSHYRVQIQAANLSRAEDLGWARGE